MLDQLKRVQTLDEFIKKKSQMAHSYDKQIKLRVVVETEDDEVYDQDLTGTSALLMPTILEIQNLLNKTLKDKECLVVDNSVFARPIEGVMNKQKLRIVHLEIPEFMNIALTTLLLRGLDKVNFFIMILKK